MTKIFKSLLIVFSVIAFLFIAFFGYTYSKGYFLKQAENIKNKNQEKAKTEEEKSLDEIASDIKTSSDLEITDLESIISELELIDLKGI